MSTAGQISLTTVGAILAGGLAGLLGLIHIVVIIALLTAPQLALAVLYGTILALLVIAAPVMLFRYLRRSRGVAGDTAALFATGLSLVGSVIFLPFTFAVMGGGM